MALTIYSLCEINTSIYRYFILLMRFLAVGVNGIANIIEKRISEKLQFNEFSFFKSIDLFSKHFDAFCIWQKRKPVKLSCPLIYDLQLNAAKKNSIQFAFFWLVSADCNIYFYYTTERMPHCLLNYFLTQQLAKRVAKFYVYIYLFSLIIILALAVIYSDKCRAMFGLPHLLSTF